MLTLDFGNLLILLILALAAIFGYYQAFMSLLTRRASFSEERILKGKSALAIGLVQLLGAIVVSAVVILFYFTLIH